MILSYLVVFNDISSSQGLFLVGGDARQYYYCVYRGRTVGLIKTSGARVLSKLQVCLSFLSLHLTGVKNRAGHDQHQHITFGFVCHKNYAK